MDNFLGFTMAALKHCLLLRVEHLLQVAERSPGDMKAIWKGIEYQVKGAWSGSADNFADIIDQFTKDPGSRTREKLTGLIVNIRTDLMATVIELTNEITSDTSSDNAPENYMIPKAVVLRRAYDTIKLMTRNSTDCLPTEFRNKIRKNYGGDGGFVTL
jgi:hypothetical protein